MTLSVSVEADVKQLTKDLNDLQKKRVPFVTNQAINQVGKDAEKASIKSVAKTVGVAQKIVKKRLTNRGQPKGQNRVTFIKASSRARFGRIIVYLRGIGVHQVPHRARKSTPRGVSRRGGRFYKGAFVAKGRVGNVSTSIRSTQLVYKRRPNRELMVPRIGVRDLLLYQFRRRTSGRLGRRLFQRTFHVKLEKELTKKGLK